MRIEVLCTDENHPINPHLFELQLELLDEHSVSILRSQDQLSFGDILFLVSCSEIVERGILLNFKHSMVLHASDLPKGRGWSPHIWELLHGAEQITVSMLDAADVVDCGDIYRKITVNIPRSALWKEISDLLFTAEIQMMKFAVENFDNLQKFSQNSETEATWYPKRNPKDSEIDPNKPISDQFDLIRVCDHNRFPAHFYHRGEAYKIILEKL